MCLDIRLYGKRAQAVIRAQKKSKAGYIRVCKQFNLFGEGLVALYHAYRFKRGLNTTTCPLITTWKNGQSYKAGFHSYAGTVEANSFRLAIHCYIREEWIVAVGRQDGETVLVTDRIIIRKKDWDTFCAEWLKKFPDRVGM